MLVERAPAQEQVHTKNIDIGRMLPALHHTADDAGRYVTAGIVIARDPDTGVYNASYHRLMLAGPNRAAIQLDFGRHLRAAFERAQKKGQHLPVVVCIGSDLALHYTAATMGSQMPEHADELAVAGGLCGRPLPVVKAITQDLLVPAESEIVLEGVLKFDEEVMEGPFGEFVGYLAPADPGPVLESRRSPIAPSRSITPSTATAARPWCCANTCWRRACSRCCKARCRSSPTPR